MRLALINLVFAVTLVQGHGFHMEEYEAPRALPSAADTCKKDILIVLDMSNSIGRDPFVGNIKPFIKKLIAKLDVDHNHGSQIAFITFSDYAKTDILFNFGKFTTKAQIEQEIEKKLDILTLGGGYTRTGVALKLANEKVFKTTSPNNYRPGIEDVAIILTDGRPKSPVSNEKKEALAELVKLHNKNIKIIGIAIGEKTKGRDLKTINFLVKAVSSPELLFEADKSNMDAIMKTLVSASCKPIRKGDCNCPNVRSRVMYVTPGQTSRTVTWKIPTLQCNPGTDLSGPRAPTRTVTPNIASPYKFKPGEHNIIYKYTFHSGQYLDCLVQINVKACQCPSTNPVVVYTNSGKGSVSWTIPKPNCPVLKTTVSPTNVAPPHDFPIGQHTVTYKYDLSSTASMTCDVKINVKACTCVPQKTKIVYVTTTVPYKNVFWTEPKPSCPGIKTDSVTPNVSPGAQFRVGQHKITYKYSVGGLKFTCDVNIVVKACQCSSTNPIVVHTNSGKGSASWAIPKPNCPVLKTTVSPSGVTPPHSFSVGQHTVKYKYDLSSTVSLTCDVKIEVKACQCPSINPVVVYTDSGKGSASWTIPKPNCPVLKTTVSPSNVSPPHVFPIGQHTVTYKYDLSSTASMTCDVKIHVKACSCIPQKTKLVYVTPEVPMKKVFWTEPKPSCPGIKTDSITPNVRPGAQLRVGQHKITYKYSVGGLKFTCDVNIEIKVLPCQNKDYDMSTTVCCCGELHKKKSNHECCGKGYHDKTTSKCCNPYYNIVGLKDSCPGTVNA